MQELAASGLERTGGAAVTPVDRHDVVAASFEAYHAELYGFLRRGTRDESAAEDLLQDAFLRLAREISKGRSPDNIRAWLYRVAANLIVSRARKRKTITDWISRQSSSPGGSQDGPEVATLQRERSLEVDVALASLPADARTALLLASEGFSGHEIAEAIGRTDIATRAMMCRARVRVRLELERSETPT
jgi:RNA polymerase sigma-70 factor (ECF subfamily)